MLLFAFLFFRFVRVLCLRQQRYLRRIHLMVQNGGHMDPHPLSLQRNVLRAVVGYHAQRGYPDDPHFVRTDGRW